MQVVVAAGVTDATWDKLKYARLLILQSEGSQNRIIGAAPPLIEELTVATDLKTANISLTNEMPNTIEYDNVVLLKKTGRPKGTSEVEKQAQHERKAQCVNAIVSSYASAKTDTSDGTTESNGSRVSKGFLANLINEKKKEFGLSDNVFISPHTVFYRMKHNDKYQMKMTIQTKCLH